MDFYWVPGVYLLNASIVEAKDNHIAVSWSRHHRVHRCIIQFTSKLSHLNLDDIIGKVVLRMKNGLVQPLDVKKLQCLSCVVDLNLTVFDEVEELNVSARITTGLKIPELSELGLCTSLEELCSLYASTPEDLNVLPQIYLEVEYLTPDKLYDLTYDFLSQRVISDLAQMCMRYIVDREYRSGVDNSFYNSQIASERKIPSVIQEPLHGELEPWAATTSYENEDIYDVQKLDPSQPNIMDIYVLESDVDTISQISYLSGGNTISSIFHDYWKIRTCPILINGTLYRKIPIFINVTTLSARYVECKLHIMRRHNSQNNTVLWKHKFSSHISLEQTQDSLFQTSFVQTRKEYTFNLHDQHYNQYNSISYGPNLFYRFVWILKGKTGSITPRYDSLGRIQHPIKSIQLYSRPVQTFNNLHIPDLISIKGDGTFYHAIVPMLRGEDCSSEFVYQYIFYKHVLDSLVLDKNHARPSPINANRISWDVRVEWDQSIIDTYYKDETLRLDLYVEKENI